MSKDIIVRKRPQLERFPVSKYVKDILNVTYTDEGSERELKRVASEMKPIIQYTERIYKSKKFFDCLSNSVNIYSQLFIQLNITKAKMDKNAREYRFTKPLFNIWKRGDFTPHYIRVEGTIAHFGKAQRLPRAERDAILFFLYVAISDYRLVINYERRLRYKMRMMKKRAEELGADITIGKVI